MFELKNFEFRILLQCVMFVDFFASEFTNVDFHSIGLASCFLFVLESAATVLFHVS